MRSQFVFSAVTVATLAASSVFVWRAGAQPPAGESFQERAKQMSAAAEAKGLAEPFKGVTTDGSVVPGLFAVRSTGVSTEPVRVAAQAFLDALTADQRRKTTFPVDDPEWRSEVAQQGMETIHAALDAASDHPDA